MAAKRPTPFERKLARIRELGSAAPASAVTELCELLADREPYVAGAAAEAVAQLGLRSASADLAAALVRMIHGEQPDAACMASAKVVEALLKLEADEPDAYRAGLGYVRMELAGPPPPLDRAVAIRVASATALVQTQAPRALLDVVPLLHDAEPDVRAGAARAIAQLGNEAAAAVLHVKLAAGDASADVLGACLEGLLAVDAPRYLPLLERALGDPRLCDLAALALGESRLDAALPVLRRALEECRSPRRAAVLLLAVSLLRSAAALELLFHHLEHAPAPVAAHAVGALAVHRHSSEIAARARRTVATRRSATLDAALARAFDKGG